MEAQTSLRASWGGRRELTSLATSAQPITIQASLLLQCFLSVDTRFPHVGHWHCPARASWAKCLGFWGSSPGSWWLVGRQRCPLGGKEGSTGAPLEARIPWRLCWRQRGCHSLGWGTPREPLWGHDSAFQPSVCSCLLQPRSALGETWLGAGVGLRVTRCWLLWVRTGRAAWKSV